MYPWYWAIIDGNKFGVTLHFINEKIDAGDILFQTEIPFNITDTGGTLYKKMLECLLNSIRKAIRRLLAYN